MKKKKFTNTDYRRNVRCARCIIIITIIMLCTTSCFVLCTGFFCTWTNWSIQIATTRITTIKIWRTSRWASGRTCWWTGWQKEDRKRKSKEKRKKSWLEYKSVCVQLKIISSQKEFTNTDYRMNLRCARCILIITIVAFDITRNRTTLVVIHCITRDVFTTLLRRLTSWLWTWSRWLWSC